MLLSLSILFTATLIAALSVLVQYTRDAKRRKNIQRKVEGIVSPLFLLFVIYLIGWQRENIVPVVLAVAAVIMLLIPLMLYPFSPAAKEEPHRRLARSTHRKPERDPLDCASSSHGSVPALVTTGSSDFSSRTTHAAYDSNLQYRIPN